MNWDTTTSIIKNIFMSAGIMNIGLNISGLVFQFAKKIIERRKNAVRPELEQTENQHIQLDEIPKNIIAIETKENDIKIKNLE
jgi:regulatory protein YycI of two-component signal transduction system YycFG